MNSPVTRPDTLVLCELALLAGRCGRSLTLVFAEYPAPLLAALWRHLASALPRSGVLHVECRGDVKDLRKNLATVRLVTVRGERLRREVAWTIASATGGGPRPAVFSSSDGGERDLDPGATLVLRASERELTAISSWLRGPTSIVPLTVSSNGPDLQTAWISALGERLGWREVEIVLGLTCGAHLRRTGTMAGGPIGLEDYQRARELLHSELVATGDDAGGLARTMVGRANVYITVRYGPHELVDHPLRRCPRPPAIRNERPVPITRREVADLGNTKSVLIGGLLEYAVTVENGLDEYVRMGLVGASPQRRDWPPDSIETLRPGLCTWSAKQVRTHFDRLVRQGLITAERTMANGPWQYVLPEELATASNPFRDLPATLA